MTQTKQDIIKRKREEFEKKFAEKPKNFTPKSLWRGKPLSQLSEEEWDDFINNARL